MDRTMPKQRKENSHRRIRNHRHGGKRSPERCVARRQRNPRRLMQDSMIISLRNCVPASSMLVSSSPVERMKCENVMWKIPQNRKSVPQRHAGVETACAKRLVFYMALWNCIVGW